MRRDFTYQELAELLEKDPSLDAFLSGFGLGKIATERRIQREHHAFVRRHECGCGNFEPNAKEHSGKECNG